MILSCEVNGYTLAYHTKSIGNETKYSWLIGCGANVRSVSTPIVIAIIDDDSVCNASDCAEYIDNKMAESEAYAIRFTFKNVDWEPRAEDKRCRFIDTLEPSDIGEYVNKRIRKRWKHRKYWNKRLADNARRGAFLFT